MDSMRSLNKSLPSSQPNRQAPPEQLLQAFRSAALSVTNLYKSAAADQASARQSGYQDALEDLLKFLDHENLGLQDGEGWKIRQWATQRYDGSNGQSDVEDDTPDVEPARRSSSPTPVSTRSEVAEQANTRQGSAAESDDTLAEDSSDQQPAMFQFTGGQTDNAMQTDEMSSRQTGDDEPSSSSSTTPIRVELLNRNNRSSRPHSSRHGVRSSQRDFNFTSGTKRKLQFPDFFDISSLHDKRDGSSGGSGPKRGRFA